MIRTARLAVLAAFALAAFARPGHGEGHGIVVDSTPRPSETVTVPPKRLVIRFNSRLEKRLCWVTLVGPQQGGVLLVRQEDDAPPDTLIYPLPPAEARPVSRQVESAGGRRPRHRGRDLLHRGGRGRPPSDAAGAPRRGPASHRIARRRGRPARDQPGSTPAGAHAVLVRSTPPGRATLAEKPDRVQLWFNERLEPAFSSVSMWSSTGTQVDAGDARVGP